MDPFYYGKPDGPCSQLLPPSPAALSALGPCHVPLPCSSVTMAVEGPPTPPFLPSLFQDYETIRKGGLIFAALAFVVGLLILLSEWGRGSWLGQSLLEGTEFGDFHVPRGGESLVSPTPPGCPIGTPASCTPSNGPSRSS